MEAASARAPHPGSPAGSTLNRLRSDKRLAERFAAGDEAAFAILYERHRRRLLAICIGVLGSYDDAQDALQNALAAATASLRERAPEDVRAWLARVARNAAIDLARARRATSPLVGDEPAYEAGPAGLAEERAELEDLVVSLRRLPEHQRLAVVMRELGGFSYAEIGEALEVDETAVRGLIARARISLRAELEASELACATVREELAHQPDGRRRASIVRRHLRGCEGCREFAAGLRSDARALRGLAPAAGGLSLLGLASILRVTRPVAVGGAIAKGAFGAGAIQAVVACAVCLTAVEGVREVAIEPAHRAPLHARQAADQDSPGGSGRHALAVSAAEISTAPQRRRLAARGDDRRQANAHRNAARERHLRDDAARAPDDSWGDDFDAAFDSPRGGGDGRRGQGDQAFFGSGGGGGGGGGGQQGSGDQSGQSRNPGGSGGGGGQRNGGGGYHPQRQPSQPAPATQAPQQTATAVPDLGDSTTSVPAEVPADTGSTGDGAAATS